jgi:hypothetical protein
MLIGTASFDVISGAQACRRSRCQSASALRNSHAHMQRHWQRLRMTHAEKQRLNNSWQKLAD